LPPLPDKLAALTPLPRGDIIYADAITRYAISYAARYADVFAEAIAAAAAAAYAAMLPCRAMRMLLLHYAMPYSCHYAADASYC